MTAVLVTNDDGVESEGLHALADVARRAGFEVVVAAPSWDTSGASASLTGVEEDGRLRSERRSADQRIFALDASPAMITIAGLRGAFGIRPDVVLSGINRGRNTGHAVLHSGTVGAALTAASYGVRALAVSLDATQPRSWVTAARVAAPVLEWVLAHEPGSAVNLNVPDVAPGRLAGLRAAPLASVGAVRTNITEAGAGYLQVTFGTPEEPEPDTDAWLLDRGFAVVSAIDPVCAAERPALGALAEALSQPAGALAGLEGTG